MITISAETAHNDSQANFDLSVAHTEIKIEKAIKRAIELGMFHAIVVVSNDIIEIMMDQLINLKYTLHKLSAKSILTQTDSVSSSTLRIEW